VKRVLLLLSLAFLFSCSDSSGSSSPPSSSSNAMEKNSVRFNEINIINSDYEDEFGDNSGWVEFYNPYDTVINLMGFSLSTNADTPLWTFGNAQISPRSYFIVFLSGKNKPTIELARDSVDLIANAVGAWTWADNSATPIAGTSTAQHSFSKTAGTFGGNLVTRSSALGWATAEAVLKLKDWDSPPVTHTLDISKTDQILLRGYLSKDSKLEVRLGNYQSWPAVITGTGLQNDLYKITLPPSSDYPDLTKVSALRFSNTDKFIGAIDFSFNSIIARKQGSNFHASFGLKNNGGKLFLLNAENKIKDSIAYPAGVKNLSYAKKYGTEEWLLSKPPTPGFENSNETYTGQAQPPASNSLPASGHYSDPLTFTLPANIYCDKTGALPTENSSLKPGDAITLAKTAILRCAQFASGAYPSEPVMRTYIVGRLPDLPIVSIAVDPVEMFDSAEGLYSPGLNPGSPNGSPPYPAANFWRETELLTHIDFFEKNSRHAWSYPAGLRIFGNYSRANPKRSVVITFREKYGQKNLRYNLFPSHPNLNKFKHFILRNNGNNYPNDYIRDMLMTSLTEGLGVDYQKGRAVVVYYNGEYYGIHNLRERSNSDYFETNYDIDEDYIDLVKVSGEVSQGSDADYKDIMSWLEGVTLTDANLKELERRIDIDNFTNHFQSRIYYNDRDWPGNNMKRWRSNSPPSKWKFFMYDTDHGFGSYGSSNQETFGLSMLEVVTAPNGPNWPNPPQSTFLLRKLLGNSGYKNAFINRFSLLIATYFAPAKVNARIDALMADIQTEISYDQAKWGAKDQWLGLSSIKSFGNNRPAEMQAEIQAFFNLDTPYNLTLSTSGGGTILVNNLPIPGITATFKAYPNVPITLKAQGPNFRRWSDGNTNAERTISVNAATTLVAEF